MPKHSTNLIKPLTAFWLFVLIFHSYSIKAQKRKFLGITPLSDTTEQPKKGFVLMPLLYYTPDTRWAAGAAGVYYFKVAPKDSAEKETRTDYVQFLADYTQNKQADLWASWNIFTHNENYLLKGDLRFRNFPDRFYGIGNNTQQSQVERFEYNLAQIKAMFLKKVKKDFFIGFDYEFEKEFAFKYTPRGALENGSISGYRGGIGSAVGLVAVYDSRDVILNAQKGSLFEFSSYYFSHAIGSSFNFININGLCPRYWKIKKKSVLAIQAKTKLSFGDVPFLDMATLGNDDILRGYPKNRFRDKHFIATQAEYRFPLFWRFGMVAFAGAGDVFSNTSDLGIKSIKYSVGSGLRFLINPAEKINLRFDYAYGKEGGYFYFMVAESF